MGGSRRRGAGDAALAVYWTVFGLWAVLSAWVVALLVVSRATADDWCTDANTSAVASGRWSWSQLGRVCTWTGTDGPYETGPGASRWLVVLVLTAMGAGLLVSGRWIRRGDREAPAGNHPG